MATERENVSPLTLRLFGPFEARLHGQPLPRLRSRKGQWLLALLTLRHGGEVERAWLAGTLWPDSAEEAAYASLRNSLKDLRRALGPEAGRLRSPTPRTLSLDLEGAHADVVTFDQAISAGDEPALERAVSLYRGPLLEECAEEWALPERLAREQACLTALETLAASALSRSDPAAAERYLRRGVTLDPLRETAQRALMQALAGGGNYAAATQVYRELRLRLHREMNAAPDPETQTLYQQLRAEAQGTTGGARERQRGTGEERRGGRGDEGSPATRGASSIPPVGTSLPVGTVTFLFTDIEGSSQLWEQYPEAMKAALEHHDALLRQAIHTHGGLVFKTVGDAFYAAFATAPAALAAALAAQQALLTEAWSETGPLRVRMALHTGIAEARDGDYFGATLNRVARLLDAGHGGQVLLSLPTEELVRDALPEGVSLRPLGEHRLKDLVRPEQVFQLLHPELPADFPPLQSLAAFNHNLPLQWTSFIGREQEMAEVKRLLPSTPLLTLTGPGGGGKTRLALQVAADLLEAYPDGVWLVELAPLSDPALLPQTVAAALGVPEGPGRPLTTTLIEHLRSRSLLLVLDNCEHLLAVCAELSDALLRACPNVRILATSRERLGLTGERVYLVPSLSVPALGPPTPTRKPIEHEHEQEQERQTLSSLMRYEAVRLFVERAVYSHPQFALTAQNAAAVAQLCQRLDGIPLALELAAARVKALPVEQLAARLDDAFRLLTGGSRTALPRQQTLRALIDWSYDLLSEPEKTLLRRLSVFAGGWSLEAAEAVGSGDGIEAWEVLDLLTLLVEKSLVQYEEAPLSWQGRGEGEGARYRLLETVRQYARDRLLEGGETEAVRGRHMWFFVRLAEEAEPSLHGPEQAAWLERLEREHDNLRTALEWSLVSGIREAEGGSVEVALRLANALREFWSRHAYLAEGRRWIERALDAAGNAFPARRVTLLQCAAWLAMWQADHAAVQSYCEASLAICRAIGDPRGNAMLLAQLSHVAQGKGDDALARMLLEQSLALAQETGSREEIEEALGALGWLALKQDDFSAARSAFEAALAIGRELGHAGLMARSLTALGNVARLAGDYDEARARFEEGLALARSVGARVIVGFGLGDLGLVLVRQGEYPAARAAFEEGLRILQELGNKTQMIRCLEGMAQLAWAGGELRRAARLFGAAEGQREALQFPLPPVDCVDYESVPAIAAALGEELFAAAWAEGRAMPLEQAMCVALEQEAGG